MAEGARIHQARFEVRTPGRSLSDITGEVCRHVRDSGLREGLCTLFVHHTSASLLISENADPDVIGDLERFMGRLVPDGDPIYRHTAEGPDDMASHVRSVLTATTLSIPMTRGRLDLGTWQGIYLWEHRHRPHRRRLSVTIVGSG